MSDPRLELILAAKNLASGEINHLEKDLGKLKGGLVDAGKAGEKSGNMLGSLGRFALAAGAGIALGAGAAMADFTRKAMDDELVHARLLAALKANVPAWDGNEAALTRNINASERLGFTNDQLEASFASLVTATHDVTKARELQAAAEDLARLKGVDLQTASEALVKVEGGHYRMLQSLGINLKANASQEEALAAVRAAAAGQAEAYAKTGAGQFAAFNAKLEDAEKTLGQLGLKAIPLLIGALDGLITVLDFVDKALHSMGVGVDQTMEMTEAAAARGSQAAQAHLRALGHEVTHFADGVEVGSGLKEKLAAAAKDAVDAAATTMTGQTGAMAGAANAALYVPMTAAMKLARPELDRQTALAMGDVAGTIHQKRSAITDAMNSVVEGLKHPLSRLREIAQLHADLASKALAKGLRSSDPEIKANAEYAKQLIEDRLAELQGSAGAYGRNTMTAYAGAIAASKQLVTDAAKTALAGARNVLKASSPPGPESPLHEIDRWGERTMRSFGDGVQRAAGSVTDSFRLAAGAGAGGLALAGAGGAGAGPASGRGASPIFRIYLDGREIAAAMDEHMYSRLAPGGAGGTR